MDDRQDKKRRPFREIIEGGDYIWVGVSKVKLQEGWFMGIQDAFVKISQDKDITGEILRVWIFLLGRIGFENWVTILQKDIAEALGMQTSHVSRAIKGLLSKGLLISGPKVGRTTSYRINANYAWKGKATNRLTLVKSDLNN